jgi:hypothetical protein
VDLLARANLARAVISVRCLPAASSEDSVILAARRGDVLSIEIDGLEPDGATWSVMASGLAGAATSTADLPEAVQEAIDRGATLISLPLSVVVGERIG